MDKTQPLNSLKGFPKDEIFSFDEKVIPQHLFNTSAALDDLPAVASTAVALTSTTTTETSSALKNLHMKSTVACKELLLRAVKSHSSGEKKKKMRIATGSEVITSMRRRLQKNKRIKERNRLK
ncbi:hypothetical protein ILUMI_26973, partial [Ignelater luminosus]